ncbi:MAG: hypothetical protein J6Q85_06135 [Clostridia bacterium]|nr:hypothetical protein [Clostridia bacterium]
MTVNELISTGYFKPVSLPSPNREIVGAYVGDLLSWVMGRAEADNAWITIMSNVNVIAVATLTDVSCVILAEGVSLDGEVLSVALEKGVNVLSCELPLYEAAIKLGGMI